MSDFSERLKVLRKERGLTQEELSAQLNLKRSTIAAWEASINFAPELTTLLRLADFFDVSLDYLLARTNIRNYNTL